MPQGEERERDDTNLILPVASCWLDECKWVVATWKVEINLERPDTPSHDAPQFIKNHHCHELIHVLAVLCSNRHPDIELGTT